MASEKHDFIVSAISRKIKQKEFHIIYFDGKYQNTETTKPEIPLKIINHRPDIIGEKRAVFSVLAKQKLKTTYFQIELKNRFLIS